MILDKARCLRNIDEMASKARRNEVFFRPHFKTHQSLEIGSWFRKVGVTGVTVSSLEMAAYFATEWDDITVAFPVNIREIDTINDLAGRINLNLLVESTETVGFLEKNLKSKAGFFVKIDTGYHRTGIDPGETGKIDKILTRAQKVDHLRFRGFLAHAGHTYKCRSKDEILEVHNNSVRLIAGLRDLYIGNYPDLVISVGDTPSCSVANDFSMVDEIRPGNFVFYDLAQHQIGSCETDKISAAVACPIVAIHTDRNELVVYGGGVHLSKERLEDEEHGTIYGKIVENNGTPWRDPIPGMFVKNLSQEHGVVSVPKERVGDYKIGDYLTILPIHSCMTANLLKSYTTTEGEIIERL